MSTTKDIPSDLKNYIKPLTDAFDQIIQVQPLQSGTFTVTSSYVKVVVEFPNVATMRQNDIYLEALLTVSFTSTSGSDTFAIIRPAFIPYFSSIINRWTLRCGSTTIIDSYASNIRYNLAQNLMSNSITRLEQTYNNPTGAFQGGTVAAAQYARFPLSGFPNELLSSDNGIIPTGILNKLQLDLYFETAPVCTWNNPSSGPVGTVTMNYTVAGLYLWVNEDASQLIKASLLAKGLNVCHTEYYFQAYPIAASTTQLNLLIPTAFRKVRAIVGAIIRNSDWTSATNQDRMATYDPEQTAVLKFNCRLNSQRRYQDDLHDIELLPETRRIFPRSKYSDFWSTNGWYGAGQIFSALVGSCYSTGVESGVDTSILFNQITLEITFTSALTSAAVLNVFIVHERYWNIQPNGSFDIIE